MLKTNIDLTTLSALKLTAEINRLCMPLKEMLDLKFFNYIRADKDGARLTLSNEKVWFENYFKFQHYDYEILNYTDKVPLNYNSVSLWDGCHHNHSSCKLYSTIQNQLGVGHILFIFAFYESHAESFGFGLNKNISHAPQIIFNNLDIFKRFTQYFKDAGKSYIDKAQMQSFKVVKNINDDYSNPFCWGIDPQQKDELFKKLSIKKVFLQNEYANIFFTAEEAKTVTLAVQGHTYEEIAKLLNVSIKTIDYRMEKIKSKLNLKHKKDVINLFVKDHYLELLEISTK